MERVTASTLWRDRGSWVTAVLLLASAGLAWLVVVRQASSVSSGMGDATAMDGMPGRISVEVGLAFVLAWGAMMAAMMLPSAAPMILLFRALTKNTTASGQQAVPTLVFAATYLVVWLAIGVPVYAISVAVESAAAASPTVAGLLPYALGAVLVVAGAYQFSSLKRVCLANC